MVDRGRSYGIDAGSCLVYLAIRRSGLVAHLEAADRDGPRGRGRKEAGMGRGDHRPRGRRQKKTRGLGGPPPWAAMGEKRRRGGAPRGEKPMKYMLMMNHPGNGP